MPRFFVLFAILISVLIAVPAQAEDKEQKSEVYVVVEDVNGDRLEGYLRISPEELLVSTEENREKSVPLKSVEFIKLEKITGGVPGGDQAGSEGYYSVKLQNSQELFTLKGKYTFSLSTSLGLVSQSVDPERVKNLFQKDSTLYAKSQNDKPAIRDKNIIFSLQFKF